MILKIILVVGSRANWGRSRSIAIAARNEPNIDFNLVLLGSALDPKFGSTEQDVRFDGFNDYSKVYTDTVHNNHFQQSLATAQAIGKMCLLFEKMQPDYVITIADRFETMSTAISASYGNFKLIHVQGGEVSGNIDDKVRNAITMLSDYHFPCSANAYDEVVRLKNSSENVFNYGCPAMDTVFQLKDRFVDNAWDALFDKTYSMVSIHSNTENIYEAVEIYEEITCLIKAKSSDYFLIIEPNIDAGNKLIRDLLVSISKFKNVIITSGLGPHDYALAMKNAAILIGNSSSFLREAALLGKPALIMGDRQRGRSHSEHAKYISRSELVMKYVKYFGKTYSPDLSFGNGDSGTNIVNQILKLNS